MFYHGFFYMDVPLCNICFFILIRLTKWIFEHNYYGTKRHRKTLLNKCSFRKVLFDGCNIRWNRRRWPLRQIRQSTIPRLLYLSTLRIWQLWELYQLPPVCRYLAYYGLRLFKLFRSQAHSWGQELSRYWYNMEMMIFITDFSV